MSNAIYALLEVNSKILRKKYKNLYEKLATWFFYKVIHPRIQPKQLPRIIIQFLRETIGSLTNSLVVDNVPCQPVAGFCGFLPVKILTNKCIPNCKAYQ